MNFPKNNNLQWLRLIFAMQVVLMHTHEHLGLWVPAALKYFPGVPAFFFVSGFLIYASWQNAPGAQYFRNRFLRLWPALILVTLGAFAVVVTARGVGDVAANPLVYISWFVAQISLGQAYNPALFRDVGVGVMNGALWTITAEILFYLAVPILSFGNRLWRGFIPAVTALSFLIYAAGPDYLGDMMIGSKSLFDYLAITPIVWGWMFGLGIMAFQYYGHIKPLLKYAPIAIIACTAMIFMGQKGVLFQSWGNEVGLIYFAAYCWIIMWLAFHLPAKTLKPDFSYGIYIWHMPVINFLLVMQFASPIWAIILTILIAILSWYGVEKPSLRLKRKTIHRV